MQIVVISGNLGRDPELKYTPSGTAIAAFSVATTERRKNDKGEYIDETTWWKVNTFGKTADFASSYLRKGMRVMVHGRVVPDPQTGGPRVWTDKEGKPRASFELNAVQVESQQKLEQ
jgi:single-strand DNA-binding protein